MWIHKIGARSTAQSSKEHKHYDVSDERSINLILAIGRNLREAAGRANAKLKGGPTWKKSEAARGKLT